MSQGGPITQEDVFDIDEHSIQDINFSASLYENLPSGPSTLNMRVYIT